MGDTLRIHGSGVVRCAVLVYGVYVGCSLAQGIVPDGSSATTVSTAASGKHTVQIAPAAGGVSHNTYAAFNVGRSGADFLPPDSNLCLRSAVHRWRSLASLALEIWSGETV